MAVIHQYIRRAIMKTFCIVLFMFLVIASFIQVLSQLKFLGKGGYDSFQLMLYVTLLMPRNMYSLFPMIALITVTFVMGRLMLRQELVAIGAMGVGIFDILTIVCKTMLQIVVLGVLIGEGVAPTMADYAKNQRLSSFYSGNAVTVKGGLWLHEDDWYINIGSIVNQESIRDIYRYQVNEQGLLVRSEYAKTGTYVNDDWLLHDVDWSEVNVQNIQSGHDDTVFWSTMLDRKLLNNAGTSPNRQPLWILFHRVIHASTLGLDSGSATLVFWQRVLQPLICLFMLAIAVILFFDFERGQHYGLNIIKALSVGLGFYFSRESVSAFLLKCGSGPFIAAAVPLILGAMLCGFFLGRYLQESLWRRWVINPWLNR